jgi:hypothetical protein
MNNENEVRRILKARGFLKMNNRDTWTRDSWTVRIYGSDIEVFDKIERSGKYYMENIDFVNIRQIIDDIDDFESENQ